MIKVIQIILINVFLAFAQTGLIDLNNQLVFKRYGVDDGLAGKEVTDIFQDSFGFMWFATVTGLSRFDGKKFENYLNDPGNPFSISANYIYTLFEDPADSRKVLWIGTDNGLNRYDREQDRFIRYYNIPGDSTSLSNNRVIAITKSRDGSLWIGTRGGGLSQMIRPQKDQDTSVYFKQYTPVTSDTNSISNGFIRRILEDRYGNIWVSTSL